MAEVRQYAHLDDEDLEIQREKAEIDVKRAENKLSKIVEEQEKRGIPISRCMGCVLLQLNGIGHAPPKTRYCSYCGKKLTCD